MLDTRLPQPNGSFRWVQVRGLPALVCGALEPLALHLLTSRGWRLGASDGADAHGWAEVVDAIGTPVVRALQVHGTDVLVTRAGDSGRICSISADIIISNDPTTASAIQTADCVPILVADRRSGAVAAAHAGWRGLATGVPRLTVEALGREFGSGAADLIAAIGPSIRACCYGVGDEVRQCFARAGWPDSLAGGWFFGEPQPTAQNPTFAAATLGARAGRWFFDTAVAARDQLRVAGLGLDQIFVAGLCTASHPANFCSYRRDAAGAGRIAAVIRGRGTPQSEAPG